MKKKLLYISLVLLFVVVLLFVWSDVILSAVPGLDAVTEVANPPVVLTLIVAALSAFALVQAVDMKSRAYSDAEKEADFSRFLDIEGINESELEELEQDDDRRIVGEEFDIAVSRSVDDSLDENERRENREWVRDSLRETAVMRYAEVTGLSTEEAEKDVRAGDWTQDARAAGFLADEEGASVPLKFWLFDLLVGKDPFLWGVKSSIERIENLTEETR